MVRRREDHHLDPPILLLVCPVQCSDWSEVSHDQIQSIILFPGGNRYRPGNSEPTGPSVGQASLGGTADPFTGEITLYFSYIRSYHFPSFYDHEFVYYM